MIKKPETAISILNIYIVCFLIVLQINISQKLEYMMFVAAPFVAIWMCYIVLQYRYNTSAGKKR